VSGIPSDLGGTVLSHPPRHRTARLAVAAHVAAVAALALTVTAVPAGAGAAAIQHGRIYYSVGALLPDPDLSSASQVWSVRSNGTDVRQLTHVAAPAQAGGPDASPNGRRVLYVSNVDGPFQVWVMRADGSGQHRVVEDPQHDAFVPRWSPDGRHLLFTRCSTPFGFLECTIATARLDGSGLHDITGGHWADFSGAYSPHGSKIVFSGDRNGLTSAIYRKHVAGGHAHRLTPAAQEAFWPDYRPDGHQILFGDNADRPTTNMWTMRPDGTHPRQITHVGTDQNLAFARYSPDGRHVVADYFDGSTDWLVTMNLDGSHLTKIVESGSDALTLSDWAVSS
jgi:Tol biopolymer transport system component